VVRVKQADLSLKRNKDKSRIIYYYTQFSNQKAICGVCVDFTSWHMVWNFEYTKSELGMQLSEVVKEKCGMDLAKVMIIIIPTSG